MADVAAGGGPPCMSEAAKFYFLHNFVDARLPSGFVTVPRSRRQLWPLEALRQLRPPHELANNAAGSPDATVPSPSTPGSADDAMDVTPVTGGPRRGSLAAAALPPGAGVELLEPLFDPAMEAALLYVVCVDDADGALAALRRGALERLASVRSHRFQARVAELITLVRQLLPLTVPAVFQRHVEQLTSVHHSVVLPLGLLKLGRPEEMALLFKVFCDDAGMDCRLVRGTCSDAPFCEYAWAFVREDAAAPDRWLLVDVAAGAKYSYPSVESSGYTADGVRDCGAPALGSRRPFGCTEVADSPATGAWIACTPSTGLRAPPRSGGAHGGGARPVEVFCKAHLPPVDCACGQMEEFGLMVECSRCKHWSHGACRGLDRKISVPLDFCCWRCDGGPAATPPPAAGGGGAPLVSAVVMSLPETPLRIKLVLRLPAAAPDAASGPTDGPLTPPPSALKLQRRKSSHGRPGPKPLVFPTPASALRRWSIGPVSLPTPPETPDRAAAFSLHPDKARRRSSLAVDADDLPRTGSSTSSTESSPLASPLLAMADDAVAPTTKLRRRESGGRPPTSRRRRSSTVADFDINDVVATGIPAAFIKPIEVKPVFTPGWQVCSPCMLMDGADQPVAATGHLPVAAHDEDEDDDEDDSDEHYIRLHAPFEHAEQKRMPIVITQERSRSGQGMVRTVSAAALHLDQLAVSDA